MKDTVYIVYLIVAIVIAAASFFGGNAFFTRRVNDNFDKKYNADKAEREEAKREAEEREKARIERQMIIEEQLVAVGHVAVATAEDHLDKSGPNKRIATALETYAGCRSRADEQSRRSAAKYEQRSERIAQ